MKKYDKWKISKKWKMSKEKEEKGFLHRELMQVTPPGYWPGSLVVEQCVYFRMTPPGIVQACWQRSNARDENLYSEIF